MVPDHLVHLCPRTPREAHGGMAGQEGGAPLDRRLHQRDLYLLRRESPAEGFACVRMKIVVVGLNHKTADVDVREKLAFNGPKLEEGLLKFRELPGVQEAVVLSTCNRVEMYADVK